MWQDVCFIFCLACHKAMTSCCVLYPYEHCRHQFLGDIHHEHTIWWTATQNTFLEKPIIESNERASRLKISNAFTFPHFLKNIVHFLWKMIEMASLVGHRRNREAASYVGDRKIRQHLWNAINATDSFVSSTARNRLSVQIVVTRT